MDKLLVNFRNVYQNEIHDEWQTMAHTCDELRHLVLFVQHIVSSSNNDQQKNSSIDLDNPFSSMIEDLSNDTTNSNKYSILSHGVGRGTTRRLMASSSNSLMPSFSCRQIDQIATIKSKVLSFFLS